MPSIPNAKSATATERWLRGLSLWLLISVAVHLGLLGYIATWTVRHLAAPRRDPLETRIRIRPEDADRMREFLEQNNIRPLHDKLETLEQIARDIEREREVRVDLFERFQDDFVRRVDEQAADALDRVLESLEAVLAEEGEAADKVEAARRERTALSEAVAATNVSALLAAGPRVRQPLREGRQHLDRARGAFERVQARMSDVSSIVSWLADADATSLWASAVQSVSAAEAARDKAASTLGTALKSDESQMAAYTGSVARIRDLIVRETLTAHERRALQQAQQTAIRSAAQLAGDSGAQEAVRHARDAAAAAVATLRHARETLPQLAARGPLRQADLDEAPPRGSLPPPETNAAALYLAALRVEASVASAYRDARAAELAALQGIPLSDARARVQVPVSQPPAVDLQALAGPVRSARELKAFEAAFDAAHQHITAMLAAASAMRNQLVGSRQPGDEGERASADIERMLEQTTRLREVRELASEVTGPVQDLVNAMRELGGGTGEGRPAAGPGTRPGAGPAASPPPRGMGGVPGRRVADGGRPVNWFYVGSWYVIGPFPNENRRNIDTVFPPESVVDLDAVYSGKDGKAIRWQYVSSPSPAITPPDMAEYAIYYAWTELDFDRECDLWLAIGSDDRSDLWVNGVPVWRSSNVLKGWNPWEGLRRVHFRKGRNALLVRLENGWKGCAFSVLVHASESARL